MSDTACFYIAVGFAVGMWFLGSGIEGLGSNLGSMLNDALRYYVDHRNDVPYEEEEED
jgi:ABC-type dipeptide/oligopeptide/nickel transport system permease subunit